ncbi:putative ATPase [Heterostelium album PN500]|uniref:Putative ATPase n=1 Tax=Heterostelium pallidum (strain ATCC 26659 / Pp 5 / PN500) TaxID=670386 RepID=D3BPG6_HETP5|nr:putative ATPase [Heterostelium album PN500]EFA76684.1 putative ATPase [Heterostelium album PN500]|eukprot:XP_020428816.1 putative ATPase [Heterostelium album PN500]
MQKLQWLNVRVRQLQHSFIDINREKQFIQKHSNLLYNLQYHLYVTPEISIHLQLLKDNQQQQQLKQQKQKQNNNDNDNDNFNLDNSILFILKNNIDNNNKDDNHQILCISDVIVEPKLIDLNISSSYSYLDSNKSSTTSSSSSIWLAKDLMTKLSLENDKCIMIAPIKREWIKTTDTVYLSNPISLINDNIKLSSMLMKQNFKELVRSNLKLGLSPNTIIRINSNNNNNNNNSNNNEIVNLMLSNGSIYQFNYHINIESKTTTTTNTQRSSNDDLHLLDNWRIITNNTKLIYIDSNNNNNRIKSDKDDEFESYDNQRKKIRTLYSIYFNEKSAKQYEKYGLEKPRSLLLYGPASSGKRTLARALAHELGEQIDDIVTLTSNDIIKYNTKSRGLQQRFNQTKQLSNSIFLIEHIEELFPNLQQDEDSDTITTTNSEQALETTFINILQDIKNNSKKNKVFIVGITSNIKRLDVMIRSLFDDEIKFEPPTSQKRLEIFKYYLGQQIGANHSHSNLEVLRDINDDCSGLVGGDIQLLCREAIINSLKRLNNNNNNNNNNINSIEDIKFIRDDFIGSVIQHKKLVDASSMSKLVPSMPKVSWSDIGGLEQVKQSLMEMVVWDYQHGDALRALGVKTPRGVLLYGPPGTGKTLLSKAVAFEARANFIAVNISEVIHGEIGESEKTIAEIFRVARATAPSIIFIDEIQSIFGQKEAVGQHGKNVISQILVELDQLAEDVDNAGKRVMVLAATNLPQAIDQSFMQPGRFDRALYVGPPEAEERAHILTNLAKQLKLADDVDLQELARITTNFTGSDLNGLLKKSALYAIERDINAQSITMNDISKVFWETTPTITHSQIEMFKEWEQSRKKQQQQQ